MMTYAITTHHKTIIQRRGRRLDDNGYVESNISVVHPHSDRWHPADTVVHHNCYLPDSFSLCCMLFGVEQVVYNGLLELCH